MSFEISNPWYENNDSTKQGVTSDENDDWTLWIHGYNFTHNHAMTSQGKI